MKLVIRLASAICIILSPALLKAETLVAYSCPEGNQFAPTTVAAGIFASNLNANPPAAGTVVGSFNIIVFDPDGLAANAATAVTANTFFQFTVSPLDGSMSLTTLAFQAGKGGASDPRGWVLRSSLDNFAADLSTDLITTLQPNLTTFTVNLPAAFSGLAQPVTFRIYTFSPNNGAVIHYDNIQIEGSSGSAPIVEFIGSRKIKTAGNKVALKGFAFDSIGIAKVQFKLNNRPFKLASGTSKWRFRAQLKDGRNKVTVVATDLNGNVSSPKRFVILKSNKFAE